MSTEENFDDESFANKVKRFAAAMGKKAVEMAYTLFYALSDRDTPAWARTVIVAALGYLVVPIDAVPDLVPGAGLADDGAALAGALATVAAHIKKDHLDRAKEMVKSFFG